MRSHYSYESFRRIDTCVRKSVPAHHSKPMTTTTDNDPAPAALDRFGHSAENSYGAISDRSGIPLSTLWHRDHGRVSIKQRAANQQYLTPEEEKALVDYLLRMSRNGYPLPIEFARNLAHVISLQRASKFHVYPVERDDLRPPGKNWPQAFHKRHSVLKPMRLKALDWKRHDHHIYEKVVDWFSVIEKELAGTAVLTENICNMDGTGVLLSVLNALKVLVSRSDLRNYRGTGIKRTLITAIECISADGRCLPPLVIWPAATHRSSWTVHPTPGWHFGRSDTGYTDTAISLYWIKHVFDPLTKVQANSKPRILINDGFGTHESLELMEYCYENNIILCRLPSHTSHKLQPCDVGIFGPLKTSYREEVERLYRGGSNMIGKQHFTMLYDRARRKAINPRNIMSGWSKTGLRPFNPERVLREIQTPQIGKYCEPTIIETDASLSPMQPLQTPTTSEALKSLRTDIEKGIIAGEKVDNDLVQRVRKVMNAAEKAFADRAILLDENALLFEQNNEKIARKSTKVTVVGTAKVLSYEDIVEAQRKREAKEAKVEASRGQRHSKRSYSIPAQVLGKRTRPRTWPPRSTAKEGAISATSESNSDPLQY